MKKYLTIMIMLLLAALTLPGCASTKPTEIKVDLAEFMFTPAEYTVPAGGEVRITLVNNGAVEHEFVIMKYGTEVSIPFDDNDEGNIYWEHEVGPGMTETVTFTAPTDIGEHQIVCGVAGHLEAGMVGKLFVEP